MPILQATPPNPDELEVSVFGPGFGESVVIHVGGGEWIIIDSCVDSSSRTPKQIEYLKLLGLEPAECVRVVVATHWHDDHVAGLSEALDICRNAVFCCPLALSRREFLDLAEIYCEAPIGFPPGPKEIRNALEIAAQRSKIYRRQMLRFAKSDSLVWTSSNVRLVALSPSDEMNRRALEFMARAYASATSGAALLDRLTPGTPNDTAAALRLDVGGRSVLLGSDLECDRDPLIGWSAVLTSPSAGEKKSLVYKIAHHGSRSGHHDGVWADLLEPRPFALMSPFRWGRHKIPNETDRARILSLTDRSFITSHPDKDAPPVGKRQSKVEAFIRQTAKSRRLACGPVGHIRWRASLSDLSDEGRIELFDGALRLGDTVSSNSSQAN